MVLIDASSATGSSPNIIDSRLELFNNVTIRSPNKPMTMNGPITGPGSLHIDSGQDHLKQFGHLQRLDRYRRRNFETRRICTNRLTRIKEKTPGRFAESASADRIPLF
jgi:hypothetical protein